MNTYPLPPDVDLRDVHQYAKDLLRAAEAGAPGVLARFAEISKHPSRTAAQLLVAREFGFASWSKLRQQIERNAADPNYREIRLARRYRGQISSDEGCAVVPVELVVARLPAFSLAVCAVRVYSTCYVVDLSWVNRRTTEPDEAWRWWTMWLFTNPFFPRPEARVEPATLTVEYADGASASNRSDDWAGLENAHAWLAKPRFSQPRGSGGARDHRGTAWYSRRDLLLWPLPPPGELRLTFDWPAFGARGLRAVLDATAIHAATRRVRRFPGGAR
ncbi:hypothetical protein [Flindersiella endophytica]